MNCAGSLSLFKYRLGCETRLFDMFDGRPSRRVWITFLDCL